MCFCNISGALCSSQYCLFCGIRELSGDQSSWCQLRKCQNKEKKEWIKQTGAHVAERALCCLISLMSNARCVAFQQSCSFTAKLKRSSEAYAIWACIDLFVISCLFLLTAVLSPVNCWPLYLQAELFVQKQYLLLFCFSDS